MLWVLKRNVWFRQFFWAHITYPVCLNWLRPNLSCLERGIRFLIFIYPLLSWGLDNHSYIFDLITVKPVLRGHLKRRPKIGFQYWLSLNAGQKYCRMLQESNLQYFWSSLSYHFVFKALFCLFLSGRWRQVLLYILFTEDFLLTHWGGSFVCLQHIFWLKNKLNLWDFSSDRLKALVSL